MFIRKKMQACALGKFLRAQYDLKLIPNTSTTGRLIESLLQMLPRNAVP